MIEITQLKEASSDACSELNALTRELSPTAGAVVEADLQRLLSDDQLCFYVAKEAGKIIGMASLYLIPKIGRTVARVEDVIVDGSQRGKGIGEKLMRAVLTEARARGVSKVYLTSNADRSAAHGLYKKLGFETYDTVTFRLKLG